MRVEPAHSPYRAPIESTLAAPVAAPGDAALLQPVAGAPIRQADPAADVIVDIGVPPMPPAAVLEQVEAARQRAAELARDDRELHFRKDEAANRIIVEVRDLRGEVVRVIPPSSALAIMSGEQEA